MDNYPLALISIIMQHPRSWMTLAVLAALLLISAAVIKSERYRTAVVAVGSSLFSAYLVVVTLSFETIEKNQREDLVATQAARADFKISSIALLAPMAALLAQKDAFARSANSACLGDSKKIDFPSFSEDVESLSLALYGISADIGGPLHRNSAIVSKINPSAGAFIQLYDTFYSGLWQSAKLLYQNGVEPVLSVQDPVLQISADGWRAYCNNLKLLDDDARIAWRMLIVAYHLYCVFDEDATPTKDEFDKLADAISANDKKVLPDDSDPTPLMDLIDKISIKATSEKACPGEVPKW